MAGRPPGKHSGGSLVVQRGKGVEQSVIFGRAQFPSTFCVFNKMRQCGCHEFQIIA
jgi:hypothetical protein